MDSSTGLSSLFYNHITYLKENTFYIICSVLNCYFCLSMSLTEHTPGDHSNCLSLCAYLTRNATTMITTATKWVTHTQGVSCPWHNPFSVVQPLSSRLILFDTPHFQNQPKTSAKLLSSNLYLLMRYDWPPTHTPNPNAHAHREREGGKREGSGGGYGKRGREWQEREERRERGRERVCVCVKPQ